jgi:hypothetical protein
MVAAPGAVGRRKIAHEQSKDLSMIKRLKWLMALGFILLLSGCASDKKPQHASYRKWYQGDMDNEERAFYLDSFFDRR